MSDNQLSNSASETSQSVINQGHFSVALHGSFVVLIPVCLVLVQMKYHSTDPYQKHPVILFIVIVSIVVYAVAEAFVRRLSNEDSRYYKISSKVCLLSGALATVLLVVMVIPILGWVLFSLWAVFFSWAAYDSYQDWLNRTAGSSPNPSSTNLSSANQSVV